MFGRHKFKRDSIISSVFKPCLREMILDQTQKQGPDYTVIASAQCVPAPTTFVIELLDFCPILFKFLVTELRKESQNCKKPSNNHGIMHQEWCKSGESYHNSHYQVILLTVWTDQGFHLEKNCIGSELKVYLCPKAENGVHQKKIQTHKTMQMHISKQFSLYKSQTTLKCAHLNWPHILPWSRPNQLYGPC